MTTRIRYKALLNASFTGDFDTAEAISEELGDVPWQESGALLAAVFALAVESRFQHDSGDAAVSQFLEEARIEFADAQPPLDLGHARSLVRAVLGEHGPMEGVSPQEAVPVQMALTHKILADRAATAEDVARLLDEAEELVDKAAPTA